MENKKPDAPNSPKSVRPSFAENIYGAQQTGEGVTSRTSVQLGNTQICESALAQRRAAYLPKLRELSTANNQSQEQNVPKAEMEDISFNYTDCDSFANELAELYSYSEVPEWATNLELFQSYAQSRKISTIWIANDQEGRKAVFGDLVEKLESADPIIRLESARILLYILQGAYGDLETPYSEIVTESIEEFKANYHFADEKEAMNEFCLAQAACNAYLAYESGLFRALCALYLTEFNDLVLTEPVLPERGPSSMSQHSINRSNSSMDGDSRSKKLFTLTDNEILRVILSCFYHIVESIRRNDVLEKCTQASDYSASRLEGLQKLFLKELGEPLDGVNKPLLVCLMDVVPPFVKGSCSKYPIKKVLLLSWKIILATLGDFNTLREEKQKKRDASSLSQVEDTVQVGSRLSALNFADENVPGDIRRVGQGIIAKRARPTGARAFKRQEASQGTFGIEESVTPEEPSPSPNAENEGEESLRKNEYFSKPLNAVILQKNADGQMTPRPVMDGPPDSGGYPQNGEQTPVATSPVKKAHVTLPWTSKVKKSDVERFIETARQKFLQYKLPGDDDTLFGLPKPVQQSVAALRKHVFVSLGELQADEDALLNKYPFSRKEQIEDTPTERVYAAMLPNISGYAVSILKVLLAAVPASKAKNDGALILSDVLSRSCDAQDMLSNSLNLDVSATSSNLLEEAVRLAIDINRHKEIVVKASLAIIIYLLKFFRLSHIYQYENFAQQLVLSNCLPLILKFLDQNMVRYIQSKNELAPINYPQSVIYYVQHNNTWPELNADNVEECKVDNQRYFLWRNVYSSVNLVRILNKLTKNKQSRTMMLVVFKSAPILRRCLKVRLGIFQLYTLKLLKMQARYLGRQWRRNNMELISAVYSKVRHRLNDDWAFANVTRCKAWDIQQDEMDLKEFIEKFNARRYTNAGVGIEFFEGDDYKPVDNSVQSLLSEEPEFTDYFKRNYERWLDEAVFGDQFEWDSILTSAA